MKKNRKLAYFGIGLLLVIILLGTFLIFGKGSAKYFMCPDTYIVTCQGLEEEKNIPCFNDKDCSVENMHNYCDPGWADQLKCAGARYYCGDNGHCNGCVCF